MQDRNAEMVENLVQDFPTRNEYAQSGARLSDVMMWLNRDGGGSLMWAHDAQGAACYGGGSLSQWTQNNVTFANYAAVAGRGGPYVTLDGVNQYLSIANQAWQQAGAFSLLVWAWCYPTDLTNSRTLAAKYVWATNNRSWTLRYDFPSTDFLWLCNQTGPAGGNVTITSTYAAAVVDTWYFVAGYFEPSTQMKVYVGASTDPSLTITTLTVGVPALLFPSIAPLTLGADGNPSTYFIGREGIGLARVNVPAANINSHVTRLFQATRWFYGG